MILEGLATGPFHCDLSRARNSANRSQIRTLRNSLLSTSTARERLSTGIADLPSGRVACGRIDESHWRHTRLEGDASEAEARPKPAGKLLGFENYEFHLTSQMLFARNF